jgi:hypothetical protein
MHQLITGDFVSHHHDLERRLKKNRYPATGICVLKSIGSYYVNEAYVSVRHGTSYLIDLNILIAIISNLDSDEGAEIAQHSLVVLKVRWKGK